MSELSWPLQFELRDRFSVVSTSENQTTRTVVLFSSRFGGSILVTKGGSILVSGHNLRLAR